jgi:hypothetical protein
MARAFYACFVTGAAGGFGASIGRWALCTHVRPLPTNAAAAAAAATAARGGGIGR